MDESMMFIVGKRSATSHTKPKPSHTKRGPITPAAAVMVDQDQCGLLQLPAELRVRIWEYVLAPTGTLCLTRTNTKRFATDPVLAPRILATCRQIHHEAASMLYAENSICITVDAHDTCWPLIPESRLPQRVLGKLQHMCIILNCINNFSASYEDVDWTALSALTSLQTLRIALVRSEHDSDPERMWPRPESMEQLLPVILERIPAAARVTYGTKPGSPERGVAERLIETSNRARPTGYRDWAAQEVAGTEIGTVAASLTDMQQGCKSGGVEDVSGERRDVYRNAHQAPEGST